MKWRFSRPVLSAGLWRGCLTRAVRAAAYFTGALNAEPHVHQPVARKIATSRPIPRIGMLPSLFSFERCSGTTTNDHRLSCYECAVPPGTHLAPGGEVVMRERFFGVF